jgi:peptidoglycan LD-endopeptidase CwlK
VIVDSNITPEQAIRANPSKGQCPARILRQQCLLTVHYVGFDGQLHRGQIVVHEDATTDIHDFFALAEKLTFPISGVVPLAHPDYTWDRDQTVLRANLTYGFNYRPVHGTGRLSDHSHGLAIDVNPMQNPYIRHGDKPLHWPSVVWSPKAPGTLTATHPLVRLMESRGWTWSGHEHVTPEGHTVIDYMHFGRGHY